MIHTRDAEADDRPLPAPAARRPAGPRRRCAVGRRSTRGLAAGLPLFLVLAGCTAETPPAPEPEQASPFADCAALTAPPPSAAPISSGAPAPSAAPAISSAARLPEFALPCFTGGQPVRLTDLRGPAVINLWASWCEPCRDELPVMQRLADRAEGRLHVVGVDTGDGRDAAASFGAAKQVRMPTLYDRDRRLLTAVGRINLPVTVFVDSAGRPYVHALPLDAYELSTLVRRHTGVAVTP